MLSREVDEMRASNESVRNVIDDHNRNRKRGAFLYTENRQM